MTAQTESMEKQGVNIDLTLNPKENRNSLFSYLDFSLSVCRAKAEKKKALNLDRQKWIRLLVFTVEVYSKLLDGCQLQEISERLERLESRQETERYR